MKALLLLPPISHLIRPNSNFVSFLSQTSGFSWLIPFLFQFSLTMLLLLPLLPPPFLFSKKLSEEGISQLKMMLDCFVNAKH